MPDTFGDDRHRPAGEWVNFSLAAEVVGTQHRRREAWAFARAAKKAQGQGLVYGVNLQYEPTNPHDCNAIAVIGSATSRGFFGKTSVAEWKIGYLPSELASEVVNELVEPGLAVGVELYSIYSGHEGYLRFKVIVLGPPGQGHSSRMRRGRNQA